MLGGEFLRFEKRGGDASSHKNGRIGKIGRVLFFKKGRGISLIFILTNPFQCYLSPSIWCVCVCVCVFTQFLSLLFVFHRKNPVL